MPDSMKLRRSSGIILHPASLPGPDGIGDLGPEAFRWMDFLCETGCSLWEVLPSGPTGFGDSPYQGMSAFAGNTNLLSPILLFESGLIKKVTLLERPSFPIDHVEYGDVIRWKNTVLEHAYKGFHELKNATFKDKFAEFQQEQGFWLNDYSLFMTLKAENNQSAWYEWLTVFKNNDSSVMRSYRKEHNEQLEKYAFAQFLFFQQWDSLRRYAHKRGIRIIGDVPIFMAYDSSDAWSHPELFQFNADLQPMAVAGVPPDYFSPTGQLWGNPLYDWKVHRLTDFSWWVKRMRANCNLFDILRLDHFRGFVAHWEIPFGETTAEHGRWVEGPGRSFFEAIHRQLGNLPLVAEDLGEIDAEVTKLKKHLKLPGMKVLQFAFDGDPTNPFLPHNYSPQDIAYTGTHDNDTARGWYQHASESERDLFRRYFARDGTDIAWDMIRAVWSSVAGMCMAPMQDLLDLSSEARMNFPNRASGNWQWRMSSGAIDASLVSRLKEMNSLYGRMKGGPTASKDTATP
jgi:4-alpha-glucanotransferase